jgi:membrane protein DedA with SNARE-associated domain
MTDTAQPKRSFPTIWRVIGGALILVAVIVFIGVLVENDVRGELPDADASIGSVLREFGFLVYVGHALPYSFPILFAAWLGFILAVILGATNLYLISRRYGRRLLEHRLARFLHLTPARLEEAEHWFRRYGPWALIFGRHIPGFRVPLTVAAGILELPYRVFAISVLVSSATWAGLFLTLGAVFGSSVVNSIRANTRIYAGVAFAVVIIVAAVVFIRSRRPAREN